MFDASKLPAVGAQGRPASAFRESLTGIESEAVRLAKLSLGESGFPMLRPRDFDRMTSVLATLLDKSSNQLGRVDPESELALDRIVTTLADSTIRDYPGEWLKLLLVSARARLRQGDAAGIRATVGAYADRPYAISADYETMQGIFAVDCEARRLVCELESLPSLALARLRYVVSFRPWRARQSIAALAPYIALASEICATRTLADSAIRILCRCVVYVRNHRDVFPGRTALIVVERICILIAATIAGIQSVVTHLRSSARAAGPPPLVTRAMGGIGDLIMMEPGLRALSRRLGSPVEFVIPRRFFAIFEGNPAVVLTDIDELPIDVEGVRPYFNLSNCPAAFYESLRAPSVKRGRVELFARGMGISEKELLASGNRPEIFLSEAQKAMRDDFYRAAGFGRRPLVGVQPFSRERYRDYPGMRETIARLTRYCDILVFHHLATGDVWGDEVRTTEGRSLSESLALASGLDLMLSVDSGFMHAAAAFNVPVIALFGPIDGDVRTQHMERVEVLSAKEKFPCAPCWRNEDQPCRVTSQTGLSPCMAAIPVEDVVARVRAMLDDVGKLRFQETGAN